MRIRYSVAVVLLAACGPATPPPAPVPSARSAGVIELRQGWDAVVLVDRHDSIILTLPSGEHQLQHFDRRARFSLAVDREGRITVRLDSLSVEPRPADTAGKPVNAAWGGRVGDVGVEALRVTSGGDRAAELTALVTTIVPRIPAAGIRPGSAWADSGAGTVRTDIFGTSEHRRGEWTALLPAERGGIRTVVLRLRETFEQLGDGNQNGVKITMTSQGRRSGTYYVTLDGRVTGADLSDSMSMLISVPSRKQVVPTTRISRTTVRFLPAPRAS